jgi:hypothetical protein
MSKQVVITWSKIRAVRRVVRQLPVEMLQQCSCASSCIWMCIVVEEHYTECRHSMPFVRNGSAQFLSVLQYMSDVTVLS